MSSVYVADTYKRIIAYIIDGFVAGLFYLPALWPSLMRMGTYIEIEWRWLIICWVFQLIYKVTFQKMLGGTIGKLLMRIQIVNRNTLGEITWMQSWLRTLSDHFTFFFGESLRVLAFIRFDRTHVSDWVAETRVVQGVPNQSPPTPHPWIATLLFFYMMGSGFHQAYRQVQLLEWDQQYLRFYPEGKVVD